MSDPLNFHAVPGLIEDLENFFKETFAVLTNRYGFKADQSTIELINKGYDFLNRNYKEGPITKEILIAVCLIIKAK